MKEGWKELRLPSEQVHLVGLVEDEVADYLVDDLDSVWRREKREGLHLGCYCWVDQPALGVEDSAGTDLSL